MRVKTNRECIQRSRQSQGGRNVLPQKAYPWRLSPRFVLSASRLSRRLSDGAANRRPSRRRRHRSQRNIFRCCKTRACRFTAAPVRRATKVVGCACRTDGGIGCQRPDSGLPRLWRTRRLAQPEVQHDKISAGGASCGVNNSIQLARRHPEVKSLMLLSGPNNRDGRLFLISSKLPIFTAVANDDKYAGTVESMQWLSSISPNAASRFARFPNGGHGAEMFAAHPDLTGVITQWFDATLHGRPETVPKTQGDGMDARELATLDKID